MNSMIWCDECREPHAAELFKGRLYFLCPLHPPDVIRWVEATPQPEHA